MIEKLIAEVLGEDPEAAEHAASALVDLGAEGGRALIAAIQCEESMMRSPLHDVLLAMEDPELVPDLVPLLDSGHISLRDTVFELMGFLGDDRVLEPLLRVLADESQIFEQRSAAVALGHMGRSEAVEPLLIAARNHLGDWSDADAAVKRILAAVAEEGITDPLMLLPDVAIALAQLGRHDLGPVLVRLAAFDPATSNLADLDDIYLARSRTVEALGHVTGPKMVSALKKAAREGDPEIREEALTALSYLGLPESVEIILDYVDDPDYSVRERALGWFELITGQCQFPDETPPDELRAWWKNNAKHFASGVCHRRGIPQTLRALIGEFEDAPILASYLVSDIYIISGKDLRRDRRGKRRSLDWSILAKQWLQSGKAPVLKAGGLYKYGVLRDTSGLI
ncbi:MAG: HEAT repeat domain-containing protein [Proteobacteria bacterium]|nr:HEAT repeat domain-containing protein [Pseudomonadota bacterium]